MGFMSDYKTALKKLKKEEEATDNTLNQTSSGSSFMDTYRAERDRLFAEQEKEQPQMTVGNIAPVGEKDTREFLGLDLFQKGAFEDGYQFGDVTKTILGTLGDAVVNPVKSVYQFGEGIADAVVYGAAGLLDVAGADETADYMRKYGQENKTEEKFGNTEKFLDKYSVLGETTDAVLEALGQVGSTIAIGALSAGAGLGVAGTSAATSGTMFLSGTGSGISEAYQGDATDDEAYKYGLASGAADAVWELAFGGLGKAINAVGFGKGLSSLDDMAAKAVSKFFKSPTGKNVSEYLVKSGFEGLEEVGAGFTQALAKKMTYMTEEDFGKILEDENLFEQFIVGSFASGVMQSGVVPGTVGGSLKEANQTGKDFITGMTQNEQKVVDKVYADRLAELEKNGKVSAKEKKELYNAISRDLEKGYLSTDTIEEVLGGENYSKYKESSEFEKSLQDEYDTLSKEYDDLYNRKLGDKSSKDTDRENQLKDMLPKLKQNLDGVKSTVNLEEMKQNLSKDVFNLSKGDRLAESYYEKARRSQKFEADLSQYDEKTRKTIESAINSGVLNNTNRTHELVDFIAKISADKGVLFDFTNNEKIKGTQFAVEGKIVNGYKTDSGITLNVESPKYLQSTVGHEITHVLEGTEFYKTLSEAVKNYAIAKEGLDAFNARLKATEELYKGMKNTTAEEELTADLVGDYLFQDADFVKKLSTENRNVFQKIYDEIKYLCKIVTAGSKEARELERVKKAFEDAYRADVKKQGKTQHSISVQTDTDYMDAVNRGDMDTAQNIVFDSAKAAGYEHQMFHETDADNIHVFDISRGDHGGTDYETPYGIFTKTSRKNIGLGSKQMSLLVKAQNTLRVENREDVRNKIPGFEQYYNQIQEIDNKYDEIANELEDEEFDALAEWMEENPDADMDVVYPTSYIVEGKPADIDSERYQEAHRKYQENKAEWSKAYDAVAVKAKEFITDYLRSNGYDSMYFKVDGGSRGRQTDSLIVLDPNQVKSADPVTYDDNGNVIPLSERFNQKNDDIRYSVSEAENQNGLDSKTEVVYSISKDTQFSDSAIALNTKNKYVPDEVMQAQKLMRERVAARLREMVESGVALPADKEGDTFFPNKSYGGTEENTLICPRSLAPEAFMDAVSEYIGRPLTVEEQIYVGQDLINRMGSSEELRGQNFLAQCVYCYVAADRMAQREFLGEYIKQRDSFLEKVKDVDVSQLSKDHRALAAWFKDKTQPVPELSEIGKLYQEFLNGRKPTGATLKRVKFWVDAYKNGKPMIDGNHLANIDKLVGDLSGFDKELIPQIKDAWKYAQSASWAKKRQSYVAYNGHILKWDQKRINELNKHYGLRLYSFSDFHPAFVLENMQMITDASVRGLKMLAYSKDMDFVEIYAPSGININVSTFGFEKNGNVYEDNRMGAEWEKAKKLREQHPNVGITFVATNDNMVKWALKQDWIDVVIPYHMVKTGQTIAEHFNYKNYTQESSDKKGSIWKQDKNWKAGHESSIAPPVHNNDLNTYLAALSANGLEPRFKRFLEDPETRPYYMKLVNECRLSASESKPVQPVFNEEAINRTLARLATEGYYTPIGGSVERMYEIAGETAEKLISAPRNSLSNIGETPKKYGDFATLGEEVAYAPIAEKTETASEESPATEVTEETDMFPDNLAPVQAELERLEAEEADIRNAMDVYASVGDIESVNKLLPEYEEIRKQISELEADDIQRTDSLTDADAPPEMDAPHQGEENPFAEGKPARTENPFADREWNEVTGKQGRKAKAYMYEHPEVKPFFQAEAQNLLGELNDTQRGERWYNDELHYESGGEKGWMGVSRLTSESMETMLDEWGMSYADIEKGLKAIIEDNGAENISAAKKVEFMLNDRLLNGYKNFYDRGYIEPNQEYINLVEEMQINSYSKEQFDSFMATADQYTPADIAPVKPLAKETPDTSNTPIYETKDKKAVIGQTTMFEPPKPNPKVANVLTEETAIQKEKSGIGLKLASVLVDKGQVFENLSLEKGNHEIQAKWNYALPSNTEARAQYFMEHGANGVKSLKNIMDGVNETGKTEDFYNYLYHVHNVDRMTLEERFGVENKTVFGETITADVSRRKVKQYEMANPEFKSWANDIYAYNRHLRKMLVDGNVISQKTADLWEKMYPHYVPIRRVDSKGLNVNVPLDTNKTGVNAPIKRATGGSSNIEPLFETMAMRTEQTFRAIARNRFGIELKNTLGTTIHSQQNRMGVDEAIDTIDAQEDHLLKAGTQSASPTFTVFENGERVEFEITEDMFNALKPAGDILGHRSKVIGKVGDVRRNLLTVWNPVFSLYRNPIKDIQDVAVNSKHAMKTYKSIPTAIYHMATGGQYATEYHQNGGKSNTYFDSRTKKFKKEDNAFKKVFGLPFRAIETAGEFIEEIPRLAEYIASRQEGRSVEQSMLDAARVTTNFAAGGDFTKFLNSHGFTFLNASVQGAAQHVRNFREAKQQGLKGYAKVLSKYVIAGLPTILLNSLLWDDDEEYEELNDYVKQNYYVVAKTQDGKFVRIPKGRTAAVMGELMNQMEHLVTGDDEVDFSTFNELFWNNIAPSNPVENNILAPVMQVATNTAWYGGDLVPSRLQKLPDEEQFDESTDSISKWLGEKTGFSPYKINYLLDQYSGGLGDVFLPMLTPEAESGDNTFGGNLLAPWKKELTTDKVLNNKNPGDFYDLRDELEIKSNSRNATEEDQMRSMYMDSVSWEMSDLYAQKREVQSSDMPDDRKYEAVRELQDQINELAKNAMNVYNRVEISGLYSEVGDKRYNKDAESGKWYEIRKTNSDGSANSYYQKEQEVTNALGISYSDYWNNREEYNYAYDKPEQYALSQAVGGYKSYRSYTKELWDIKADKDENGKSISGSRKEKVIDYLNNLDADYYTKIILFKNEYNADDTYNMEIIEYLNGREDISYQQMESILKYLGFEVDSEGNISW